jgi:hypothetical protein
MSGYEKSPDYGGHDHHPVWDVLGAIAVSLIIIGLVVITWAR